MLETTKKLYEELNELLEQVVKNVNVRYMSEDDLKTIQITMKIVETSKDLMVKEANMMDDMNNKINMILEMVKDK